VSSTEFHHNSLRVNQPSRSDSGDKAALRHTRADMPQGSPSLSGVVEAILEVGRQRGTLLAQLRAALESGQEKEALALARRMCGLSL